MYQCLSASYLLHFFFNPTATTEIYTLSLHDALPIWIGVLSYELFDIDPHLISFMNGTSSKVFLKGQMRKRKIGSTRLNSSHTVISYAVFCLKKKKKNKKYKQLHTLKYN